MEEWGRGMLQSQRESRLLGDYEETFGLRELRAKINAKAGFKPGKRGTQAIRLAVNATDCYGSRSVEITRKFLDSGPLAREFLIVCIDGEEWTKGDKSFRLITLAAGAMTLGCSLPAKVKDTLKQITTVRDPQIFRNPLARAQMKKAVDVRGDDRMSGTTTTTKNIGNQKVIEAKLPNGTIVPQIISPPGDEEIGLKPIYEYNVCANCGKDSAKDGEAKLLVCGKCKKRKYCSPACQEKHWRWHKIICTCPQEELAAFMESIPLDWVGEANPDFAALLGDSTTIMAMGQGAYDGIKRSAD